MRLREAIGRYVAWRQFHGASFLHSALMLYRFCDTVDRSIRCDAVTRAQVRRFLAGNGKLTRSRGYRYATLAGFFRYAAVRGHVARSPMPAPDEEPRSPQSRPPYVYTRQELELLFREAEVCRKRYHQLDSLTFCTLLRLLYGSGLRVGEAINLTLADVALEDAILTVRNAKYSKNRLVPVSNVLSETLDSYLRQRALRPLPNGIDSAFLANRDGTPLRYNTVYAAFCRLRKRVGIHPADDSRRAPCLHSLRHAFAIHRVTAGYRQGPTSNGCYRRCRPALDTLI